MCLSLWLFVSRDLGTHRQVKLTHTRTHARAHTHVFILPLQVCDCLRLCVHILFALVLTGPDGHGGGDKLTVRRRLMSGFLVSAALVYAWRYYVLRWGRGWNPQQTAVGVYESVALYDVAPMAAVDKSAVTIRKGGSDLTRDSVAKSMNMIRNLSALFTRAQGSAGSVAAAGGEASAGGAGVTTVPPSPKIHSSPAGALWGGIGALWARGGGGNDARDMDGTLARSDSLQRLLDGEAGMTLGGRGGTADIENIGGQAETAGAVLAGLSIPVEQANFDNGGSLMTPDEQTLVIDR